MTGCDPLKLSTSHRNQFYGNTMTGNGVDFWWDAFPGNSGNCWYSNGTVTTSPGNLPDCLNGKAPFLSFGFGNLGNELELLTCMANLKPGGPCPWFTTPKATTAKAATRTAPAGDHDHPESSELNDARLAAMTCHSWHEMTTEQRDHMLGKMAVFMGGQIDHPGARGTTLSEQNATKMLDNACGLSFAGPFKLYKLYARAAAFPLQLP
jgi:hypothetical protein